MKRVFLLVLILFLMAGREVWAVVEPGYGAIDCQKITGWAWSSAQPNVAINVDTYVDGPAGTGKFLIQMKANIKRQDLIDGKFVNDNGFHGFEVATPESLKDGRVHTVYFYALVNGTPQLKETPKTVQCAGNTTVPENISDTTVSLNNLGRGKIDLHITYEKANAVGDPYPNYDYSAHIMKLSDTDYRMFYGGRCRVGSDRNCQLPIAGTTQGSCGSWWTGACYPDHTDRGDGDHIRYATSSDGINWSWGQTPIVRPGRYDQPAVAPNSWEYGYRMDPSVIWWEKEQKYYMYYEVLSQEASTCNSPEQGCANIGYSTSTDLIHWTKGGELIMKGRMGNDTYKWPKATVWGKGVDAKVYLYYGYFTPNLGGTFQGGRMIASSSPISFDVNQWKAFGPYPGWSQKAILWPNDPNKKLVVGVVNDYKITDSTGHKVPTVVFSTDAINYAFSDSGVPVAFPRVMQGLNHEFCNIMSDKFGELQPLANNPNKIEALYYCATFDGMAGRYIAGTFHSDISVGKIVFTAQGPAATNTPIPTNTSIPPTSTPIPKIGDANGDGAVNIVDFVQWQKEYTGQETTKKADFYKDGKVDILDFVAWRNNFGK